MTYDDGLVVSAAAKYSIDAALGRAVIAHESNGNPFAIGDGGRAMGLMQVHEVAAKDVLLDSEWQALHAAVITENATAAELGIDLGFAYLARMLKVFDGNVAWALAAYNQGPTVILAAKRYSDAVQSLIES